MSPSPFGRLRATQRKTTRRAAAEAGRDRSRFDELSVTLRFDELGVTLRFDELSVTLRSA